MIFSLLTKAEISSDGTEKSNRNVVEFKISSTMKFTLKSELSTFKKAMETYQITVLNKEHILSKDSVYTASFWKQTNKQTSFFPVY